MRKNFSHGAWGSIKKKIMSSPGVIRSDFARVDSLTFDEDDPPYRFITTADWPDMESFRKAFYDPEMQASLKGITQAAQGSALFGERDPCCGIELNPASSGIKVVDI